MPKNVKHLQLSTIHEFTPSPFAKVKGRSAKVVIPANNKIRASLQFYEGQDLVNEESFFVNDTPASKKVLEDAKSRAQQFANAAGQYKPIPA